MNREQAKAILAGSQRFGEVVEDGPQTELVALNVLLDQPEAAADLIDIAHTGTPAGRLFALCGLQLVDASEYGKVRDSLVRSTEELDVMGGDILSREQLGVVIRALDIPAISKGMRSARARVYEHVNTLANSALHPTHSVVTPLAEQAARRRARG